MRRRLAAAAAGAVLIVIAVLAFSLGKHPVVAGTNTAAPLYAALELPRGEARCQTVSRVPAGATHLRVVVTSVTGPAGRLHVNIAPTEGGQVAVAGRKRVRPAGLVIRLERKTRAVHPATVCMTYLGRGRMILAGEIKRVPPREAAPGEPERGVASIVFLQRGLSSWASRRDTIAERFDNAQPGFVGGWSLWAAALLAVAAAVTALWWMVFRLEPLTRTPAGRGDES
jgi:hypothetical protein